MRHDRPGEEDWRWAVCSGRISREVVALFRPYGAPDTSLAEAYEAVATISAPRPRCAWRLSGGEYEAPLVITADDHAAWLRAGQPDGDSRISRHAAPDGYTCYRTVALLC